MDYPYLVFTHLTVLNNFATYEEAEAFAVKRASNSFDRYFIALVLTEAKRTVTPVEVTAVQPARPRKLLGLFGGKRMA